MILNDNHGTAIRVSDVRTMNTIANVSGGEPRYKIELRYKHSTGPVYYYYGSDKDARDKDFNRLNRHMDCLDGIQQ